MIKRALGLFLDVDGDPGQGDAKSGRARRRQEEVQEDSDDEGLTASQRRKLERRLIPGALHASTSAKKAPKRRKVEAEKTVKPALEKSRDEEEDDEDNEDEDGDEGEESEEGLDDDNIDDDEVQWGAGSEESEEEDGSDDENPQMLEATSEKSSRHLRGHLKCQLCPDKIILNEKIMEQHLKSASHLRNLKHFERAKEIGVEAYEAECKARAEARQAVQDGASKRKAKNADFWAKKKSKGKDKEDAKPAPKENNRAAKRAEKAKDKQPAPQGKNRAARRAELQRNVEGDQDSMVVAKKNGKTKDVTKGDPLAKAPKDPSQDAIEAKKRRFQEKKARRLARKAEQQVGQDSIAGAKAGVKRKAAAKDRSSTKAKKHGKPRGTDDAGTAKKKLRRKREGAAA